MSAGRRGKGGASWRPGPKPGSGADRWRRSPEFREIANKTLAEFNESWWRRPRCGARAKTTGEPCRQVALENGRCRYHGGKTPSGVGWHRLQLPKPGEACGIEKFDRKSLRQEKVQAERKRRVAAMSPNERERHRIWQATHKPGKASERFYRRQQRETGEFLAKVLADREAEQQARTSTSNGEFDVFG